MDQGTIAILFALLRSALFGTKLTEEERRCCTPEALSEMTVLAKGHDVSHLLAVGRKNHDLCEGSEAELSNEAFRAVYRCEMQTYELGRLCAALEAAEIPFLPLKGSVIRKYYPEPWMRTSCDIDVLVHREDLEKATSVLTDACGCVYHGEGSHDRAFFAPTNTYIELHYDLVEDGLVHEVSEVLKNVWEVSSVREGYDYWYQMPDEMFYFYHLAHMAKHFQNGGCGIRPFMDLWILDNNPDVPLDRREELLRQGGLLRFANVARKLSRIWFAKEQHDTVSQQMEDYILRGGVYGTIENRIAVQQQKQGGRMKYAVSKFFIPYDVIKFQYPILQKHPWLTPFMEVRRWGRLLFCGHVGRSFRELQYNHAISDDTAHQMQCFLENIGL